MYVFSNSKFCLVYADLIVALSFLFEFVLMLTYPGSTAPLMFVALGLKLHSRTRRKERLTVDEMTPFVEQTEES